MAKKKLIYFINVDWYFRLHWLERAIASQADFDVYILTKFTSEKIKKELENARPLRIRERAGQLFS